jgi:hypothetical protein
MMHSRLEPESSPRCSRVHDAGTVSRSDARRNFGSSLLSVRPSTTTMAIAVRASASPPPTNATTTKARRRGRCAGSPGHASGGYQRPSDANHHPGSLGCESRDSHTRVDRPLSRRHGDCSLLTVTLSRLRGGAGTRIWPHLSGFGCAGVDAVLPARRRDVAADFPSVTEHGQAVPDVALLLSIVHRTSLSRETPDVNNLRQF